MDATSVLYIQRHEMVAPLDGEWYWSAVPSVLPSVGVADLSKHGFWFYKPTLSEDGKTWLCWRDMWTQSKVCFAKRGVTGGMGLWGDGRVLRRDGRWNRMAEPWRLVGWKDLITVNMNQPGVEAKSWDDILIHLVDPRRGKSSGYTDGFMDVGREHQEITNSDSWDRVAYINGVVVAGEYDTGGEIRLQQVDPTIRSVWVDSFHEPVYASGVDRPMVEGESVVTDEGPTTATYSLLRASTGVVLERELIIPPEPPEPLYQTVTSMASTWPRTDRIITWDVTDADDDTDGDVQLGIWFGETNDINVDGTPDVILPYSARTYSYPQMDPQYAAFATWLDDRRGTSTVIDLTKGFEVTVVGVNPTGHGRALAGVYRRGAAWGTDQRPRWVKVDAPYAVLYVAQYSSWPSEYHLGNTNHGDPNGVGDSMAFWVSNGANLVSNMGAPPVSGYQTWTNGVGAGSVTSVTLTG